MRIGFAPAGRRRTSTAVDLARRAEEAGFAEVWVSEDYLERGAFAVAGGIAAATSSVTVGLGVINPWTRHVALAAMESAALDELSKGRLIIGLGASNERWMTDQLGIPFEAPIKHLAEYTAALRTLLSGQRLQAEVGGHRVDAQLSFEPMRRDMAIYLGVKGPRALRVGSELSDGLMLSVLSSPDYIRWVISEYTPKNVTAYVSLSTDADGSAARDRIRSWTGRFLGMHGASAITERAGLSSERAGAFRARLLENRDAADLVDDATLAMFTIAGTPAECATGLERFAAAGVGTLVIMDDGVSDPETLIASIAEPAVIAGLLAR